MKPRKIVEGISWIGVQDWDRRMFDALIPLPDGTSYNAYLITGSKKTALVDTVDPPMARVLLEALDSLDYVIANHAEQDHAGAIPDVLAKFPQAKLVCTPKCKPMLMAELHVPEDRFQTVEDGETLSLGDKTLEFIHLPWVHWPETMGTYVREDQVLCSCDFFGSHLATSDLFATDEPRVYEAAKRYFAEIMMPFANVIKKNLAKLENYPISFILPSHGPVHNRPEFILDAYRHWIFDDPKDLVVIPYVSMHGSTRRMVEHFVDALIERGVTVQQFNLADSDIGELAEALVDAATIVIGTPALLAAAHPLAVHATYVANALRPKARFASIIASFGWGSKLVEQLAGMLTNLKAEILPPVVIKGAPRSEDFTALEELAETIATKHRELGLK